MDLKQHLRLPSPAMVVAMAALFVSLAGNAGAFRGGGHHLVRKGDLAPGAVTARNLAKGAVHPRALAKGAVHARALAAGSVGVTAIASGAVGPAALGSGAVTATAIAPGAVHGVALGEETVHTAPVADVDKVAHNGEWTPSGTEKAFCGGGERLLSPGFIFTSPGDGQVGGLQALPTISGDTDGVSGQIISDSGGTATAEVVALCLK
jgi:hypothetical protein